MVTRVLWSGMLVLALLGAPACGLAGLAASAPANVAALETIALDLSGPRPTAQLAIGDGPPVTAIFDTGAAATVLRLDYANRSDLPDQGRAAAHGPGGTPVVGFRTTIDRGVLGGAHFGPAMAVALNISLPLEGIDAIVSPGVFAGRLVRFDFGAGIAQVLAKTPENIPAGPAEAYAGENSHERMARNPAVRLELPGRDPIMAIADTGSSRALVLPLSMAAGLPLAAPLAATDPVRMVGATYDAFRARLTGLVRVGPIELRDPEITFIDDDHPPLVGIAVLRNAILVLDPQAHRSWLLPAHAPPVE